MKIVCVGGGGGVDLCSHGDGEVSTLLLCSGQGDGESGLNPLSLIDELDPELVVIDWTENKWTQNKEYLVCFQ